MWCNPVVDRNGDPVAARGGEDTDVVIQKETYPCPVEEVVATPAPVAPAAPEPLPESGLVYFDFDKADITPEAQSTINTIVSDIKDRDLSGITVAGHTDTSGPSEYNMQLSDRRAQNVAAELVKEGIPARVIKTEALGETEPAVETGDGVILQENRRAEIDFEL